MLVFLGDLMAKHQVPRWMNLLWLVVVFCLTSSYLAVALWRGYDLTQTVGFLVAEFGSIFGLAVVAGLVLYAVSFLLRPPAPPKSHREADDDHSGDMANLVP
jgi:hypothetical protein